MRKKNFRKKNFLIILENLRWWIDPSILSLTEHLLWLHLNSQVSSDLIDMLWAQLGCDDVSNAMHEVVALKVVSQLKDLFEICSVHLIGFWIVLNREIVQIVMWGYIFPDVLEDELSGGLWEGNIDGGHHDVFGLPVEVHHFNGSHNNRHRLDEASVTENDRLRVSLEEEWDLTGGDLGVGGGGGWLGSGGSGGGSGGGVRHR